MTDRIAYYLKPKNAWAWLQRHKAVETCLLLILVSIGVYIYTWATHDLTVPLSGDYTIQEMTFLYNGYDDWHQFFSMGHFPMWDRSVFLGIDNIGGNSFYYLFDPFLLILLPFPRGWLLQLQGLEFIPKMTLAGMLFYWYLGEFGLSPRVKMAGALSFGFSGYAFGYLWFHFIDSCAFLPLLFLGVERLIRKKNPTILMLGFFVNAMTSYYFFVVYMFGAFFYWCYRFLQTARERDYGENFSVIGISFVGFLVSVFLGAFTLLPGMVVATGMPRMTASDTWLNRLMSAEGLKAKLNALFNYGTYNQSQLTALLNFLFMPTGCYSSNILSVSWYDNFSSSIYATTPMLLIFFVGLIQSFRKHKISHLIAVSLVALLVFSPIGFYLFSGFKVGYARWFILPTAWMITYDCITLEKRRDIPRTYLDLSLVIVMALDIVSGVLVVYYYNQHPGWYSGTDYDYRMILIPATMVWALVCYFVLRPFFHKKRFAPLMTLLMSIDIIAMGNITILGQGTVNMESIAGGWDNADRETEIVSLLEKGENGNDYYRIFNTTANRSNSNLGLREGYNGLSAFHSVYAYEAQDFLDRSRIPYTYQTWIMGIHNRRYNMETFLGTKYYLVDKVDTSSFLPNVIPTVNGAEVDYDIPFGYVDVTTMSDDELRANGLGNAGELIAYLKRSDCDKSLYVNTCFVDFGFSFDTIVSTNLLATGAVDGKNVYGRYEDLNEYPLLRYGLVEDDDYQTLKSSTDLKCRNITVGSNTVSIDDTTAGLSTLSDAMMGSSARFDNGKPIQRLYVGNTMLKADVYASNWPATIDNISGEYAYAFDSAGNALFWDDIQSGEGKEIMDRWKEEEPFLHANGINPGDTHYDYLTMTDDDGVHKSEYNRQVLYNAKVVYTPLDTHGQPTTLAGDADPSDPLTGYYISIDDTNNIQWRFFDEENRIITLGNHTSGNYKRAHGYYVDRPVSRIVGVTKAGSKDSPNYLTQPRLYLQKNSDYYQAIQTLKEHQPTIISRNDDEVVFKTDEDRTRFMVLNYPRSKGWSLKEAVVDDDGRTTYTAVDTYKAQGGFIGFVVAGGEHTYVLTYESPYAKLGGLVTLMGAFIALLFVAFFSHKKKADGNPDQISILYTYQSKQIKGAWDYDDCITEEVGR